MNKDFAQALLLSTVLAAPLTQAATYYVALNGSDANPGTQAAPFKSIAFAVDKMVAGDTTFVRSGVYLESRAVRFKKSGTQSAPIRLLAASEASPVIDFSTATDYMKRLLFQATSKTAPVGWIVVEGFEIRNSPAPIMLFNAHDMIIRRNWIHHGIAQGILGNGKNVLVDRNVISQNGGVCLPSGMAANNPSRSCNQFHGMYVTGSNWTITNNLIYDNLASGIQVAAYPWCTDGKCYGGGAENKTDATYARAENWLIANNTIAYQRNGPGITVWQGGATGARIINNIFFENGQGSPAGSGGQGISFWGSGGGHLVQNNLFYATAPGAITPIGGNSGWNTKYTATNNMVNLRAPGFVNAPAVVSGVPNFRLQPGSPAIDAGLTLSEFAWDYTGTRRLGAYDVGAYEFGRSGPPRRAAAPRSLTVR